MSLLTTTFVDAGRRGDAASCCLFLHGILGSGVNLRAIARALAIARPDVLPVLVDLRNHGDSQGFEGPHTVEACVADLYRLDLPHPVVGVVGHSFGGKVALAYAARRPPRLEVVHVLDSTPAARPDRRGSASTMEVVGFLEGLPPRLATRDELVERAVRASIDADTGRWLAMNLAADGAGGFVLALDVRAIREMLDDYFARDLWPFVESNTPPPRIHFVVGERSPVFDEDDLAKARALAGRGVVTLEVIRGAGHMVHVDAKDRVSAAIVKSFDG